MQRLTGLKPAIKAALSAGGPNAARIQALVAAVGGLLKNKDAVQANKVLDELEPLLKPAVGAGTTDLAAEWKAKLAELSPAIKGAMAAKGPNAAEIGQAARSGQCPVEAWRGHGPGACQIDRVPRPRGGRNGHSKPPKPTARRNRQ